MKIQQYQKTLLAFTIGLFIGIFAHKYFFENKGAGDSAKIENCLKELQAMSAVCPKPTGRATPEEKPIVKLEDGTFPAPRYTDDMPEMFETKHPGEFKVSWTDVPGVKKYKVRILDSKGNSVRSYSTEKHVAYVQRIPWDGSDNPFATYRVYISSLNENDEEGPRSELRKVKLYKDHAFFGTEKASPLVAPEIKSITTED